MKIDIPQRSEIIKEHKAAGERVAAVFPIHYPRELFRAHGFHPIEVWGPPGVDDSAAGAHLQSYTCAIVRNGLSFLVDGGLDDVDAVVVPNACDSLQGLGSILIDFIKPQDRPVLAFYPPRGTRPSDAEYFVNELEVLGEKLSALSGVVPEAKDLRKAVALEEEADRLLAELHGRRGELPVTQLELYRMIRSREYLPSERFSELARGVLDAPPAAEKSGDDRVPLLLSGIVPEPMALFEAIEEMGAVVVADDLAACGRRLYPAGTSDGPYRRMAERLLAGPPDPMRGSPIQARVQHLRRLARESGARGVVFYDVKFCEPEQFDLPALREAFKEQNVPTLVVEVDLARELPGQTQTRLEAFVEMVR